MSAPAGASAQISLDGRYRWVLRRQWADGKSLLWIMLNPSTADAYADDPTIRRCIRFSQREGYGALAVVNLCGQRSPDPAHLAAISMYECSANIISICTQLLSHDKAVVAWGGGWPRRLGVRPDVELLASERSCALVCLGTTKDGSPRHPLYVKGAQPFEPFP